MESKDVGTQESPFEAVAVILTYSLECVERYIVNHFLHTHMHTRTRAHAHTHTIL